MPAPELASGADLLLEQELGRGGMAQVHGAFQRSLGRTVAVKWTTAESSRGLLAEAWTMARLEHANIVPIYQVSRDQTGAPIIVMRRVDGVAWNVLIDTPDHPLWSARCPNEADRLVCHLTILLDVCNALSHAHARGIVHRDVKPHNVLVGWHGEVYLADWGAATAPGTYGPPLGDPAARVAVGTPGYLAPEMVGEAPYADERTDVYQLGATLHRLLTGRPPHDGEDFGELMESVRRPTTFEYGPDVPPALARVANVAMRVEPGDRFQSVGDFATAIRAVLAERQKRAARTELGDRAAIVVAVSALIVVMLWLATHGLAGPLGSMVVLSFVLGALLGGLGVRSGLPAAWARRLRALRPIRSRLLGASHDG